MNVIGILGREPAKQALPAYAVNAVDPGPIRSERILRLFKDMVDANNSMREELEQGFRNQIPIGRLGEPEEVARIVTFLASDAAGNLNGTCISVDGGMMKGLF